MTHIKDGKEISCVVILTHIIREVCFRVSRIRHMIFGARIFLVLCI